MEVNREVGQEKRTDIAPLCIFAYSDGRVIYILFETSGAGLRIKSTRYTILYLGIRMESLLYTLKCHCVLRGPGLSFVGKKRRQT